MNEHPATVALADWAARLRPEQVPAEVLHQARRVLIDYLAATVPGATTEAARTVRQAALEPCAAGPATVIATTLRASAPSAALANGTAAHGMEIDDGYTPGAFHPGGPVLSALLAVGEARGTDVEHLLVSIVVGFELGCRVAGAGHPATWQRGFHNTPIAGVLGAAAGVARLLDADGDLMANTLGIAASHAGGLFEFLETGAEVKRLHAGKAARDGVLSALLAERGLTGPTTVLEGKHGYFQAFAGGAFDVDHLLGGLGRTWRMQRTYIKPYPCCRHLHGPIDAVLALQESNPVDLETVEAIEVETYPAAARHDRRGVTNLLDAQMSIPFAIGTTLVHGGPTLMHFGDDARADPRIGRLADRVAVVASEDCTRDYPAMRPAVVTIRANGADRSHRIDQPYGEPDNPMTDADLGRKLTGLVAPVLGPARAKHILDEAWALTDPVRLFAQLAAPGVG